MTTFTTANETPAVGPDPRGWWWATGRRKTAIARLRLRAGGSGDFTINGRPLEEFFVEERDRKAILAVLDKTGTRSKVEIKATTTGGGFTGQAGAVILALGRALTNFDSSLEPTLREHGYLTRDARKVERKKYGQAGARRRFQFSKR
ncbi:MAG: 30S ribosomal protein S9 [Phycisphaeraceae bacterium]|nr:30S ribosomal protein S9 [Phycisphaeraceae bacterium]